jgi:hypothetical protein
VAAKPSRRLWNKKVLLAATVAVGLAGVTSAIASTLGASSLPPAKQAYLDIQTQRQKDAAARNAAQGITKSNAPALPTVPPGSQVAMDPQTKAGDGVIIQSNVAPAGDTDTIVKNRWFLSLGSAGVLVVFAGCDVKTPSEGVVLVSRGPGAPIDRFVSPGAHGCVWITGANGRILDIVAADGFRIQFDAANLTFK